LTDYWTDHHLKKKYIPVAVFNTGRKPRDELLAIVEGLNDPYFAVAYSVDQVLSISNANHEIEHTMETRRHAQHVANFFVDEARRNRNKFESFEAEEALILENNFEISAVEVKTGPKEFAIRDIYFL